MQPKRQQRDLRPQPDTFFSSSSANEGDPRGWNEEQAREGGKWEYPIDRDRSAARKCVNEVASESHEREDV